MTTIPGIIINCAFSFYGLITGIREPKGGGGGGYLPYQCGSAICDIYIYIRATGLQITRISIKARLKFFLGLFK